MSNYTKEVLGFTVNNKERTDVNITCVKCTFKLYEWAAVAFDKGLSEQCIDSEGNEVSIVLRDTEPTSPIHYYSKDKFLNKKLIEEWKCKNCKRVVKDMMTGWKGVNQEA